MRVITIALALVALTTSAQADWRHHHHRHGWAASSYVLSYEQPSAAVYSLRRLSSADEAARQERIDKWEAFCRPVAHVDTLGVSRYSYAHEGCDEGRTE